VKQAFDACLVIVSCVGYSSALKMEATCSPETLASFQQTTWHYIPEDSTPQVTCSTIFSCLLKILIQGAAS
jgi:hypothetical protein